MKMNFRKAIIILDLILIIMTASWVLFGISRGLDLIELIYNYIYVIVALMTAILNIIVIKTKR